MGHWLNMTVQFTNYFEWLSQCYEHGGRHEHVSLYLIRGDDGPILVDSGSFYHRNEITRAVEDATAEGGWTRSSCRTPTIPMQLT